MTRRLSGFKPTGHLQLGNYLGAIRPMVDSQHDVDSVVAVVDLHALTVTHDHPAVPAHVPGPDGRRHPAARGRRDTRRRGQAQHLELAREVAARFNHRYGPTFAVPRTVIPPVAARVMDLAEPTAKMGKSNASSAGVIGLLDPPEVVRRKVMRAVTDPGSQVRCGTTRRASRGCRTCSRSSGPAAVARRPA